jgi:Glycosyltransferase family 87
LSRARIDSLVYFLLGAAALLALGWLTPPYPDVNQSDFKMVYFSAKALVHHQDPYVQANLLQLYRAEPGNNSAAQLGAADVVTICLYLPTGPFLIAPFALLPWTMAHVVWSLLTAALFLFAAYLIWDIGVEWAPRVSGFLMLVLLSGSQIILETGNPAGIVVGLLCIAAWCFLRNRYTVAGTVCLGLALAFKPQDAGFIWLFFLLLPAYRRRALQALGIVAAVSIPAVLWMWRVSPNWIAELHSNLLATFAPGQMNSPDNSMVDPAVRGAKNVSLQTITSLYWSHAQIYNAVAYAVLAVLLFVWLLSMLKHRVAGNSAWILLAAVVPIAVIAGYHRQYDSRLLILAVPGCALLSQRGGRIGRLATVFTFAAALFSSDIVLADIGNLTIGLRTDHSGVGRTVLYSLIGRPVPWAMLALAGFYAWLLWRQRSIAIEP